MAGAGGSLGEGMRGASARGAGAPGLSRDGQREKGRWGARKWVLRGLEEVGKSWGVVEDTPFAAPRSQSVQECE